MPAHTCVPCHCRQVGVLDIDICGPSIPKMMGVEGQQVHQSNLGWSPVYVEVCACVCVCVCVCVRVVHVGGACV